MEPVTVNFAITHDDYMDCRMAQAKASISKSEIVIIKILGVYLLLLAALLIFYRSPAGWLSAVAAAGGVFLLFLCRPLLRAMIHKSASDTFETGQWGTPAQTVRFCADYVEFHSERYEAQIPYEMLYRAYENNAVFLLYSGIGECRGVPKRAMNSEDRKQVENLLADRMKQKYMQEGAREWTK